MLSISVDTEVVKSRLKTISKSFDLSVDKAVQKTTARISTFIKDRTLKGVDGNGVSFVPYSKS